VALKVEASCEEREKKGGEWWRAQKRGNMFRFYLEGHVEQALKTP
jgi:hypothetical protein